MPLLAPYVPTAQFAHESPLTEPLVKLKVPAGHGVQAPAPLVAAKAPARQAPQLAAPGAAKVPTPQLLQPVDTIAPDANPYVPAAHSVHAA